MSNDEEPFGGLTPEDAAVAGGQAPVVRSTFDFLERFYTDGDLPHAWESLDATLKLCWAQWWGRANEEQLREHGLDAVAEAERLAQVGPRHDLWDGFERAILRDFRAAFPLDVSTCGIGMAPRPLALDVELLFAHREVPADGLWPENATGSSVVPIVMRFADGEWVVANLGYDVLPAPGWPPRLSGNEPS